MLHVLSNAWVYERALVLSLTVLIPTGIRLVDCDRVRVSPTSTRGRACDTTIACYHPFCFVFYISVYVLEPLGAIDEVEGVDDTHWVAWDVADAVCFPFYCNG